MRALLLLLLLPALDAGDAREDGPDLNHGGCNGKPEGTKVGGRVCAGRLMKKCPRGKRCEGKNPKTMRETVVEEWGYDSYGNRVLRESVVTEYKYKSKGITYHNGIAYPLREGYTLIQTADGSLMYAPDAQHAPIYAATPQYMPDVQVPNWAASPQYAAYPAPHGHPTPYDPSYQALPAVPSYAAPAAEPYGATYYEQPYNELSGPNYGYALPNTWGLSPPPELQDAWAAPPQYATYHPTHPYGQYDPSYQALHAVPSYAAPAAEPYRTPYRERPYDEPSGPNYGFAPPAPFTGLSPPPQL